jgi:hemerythrin-like domain-containing protein
VAIENVEIAASLTKEALPDRRDSTTWSLVQFINQYADRSTHDLVPTVKLESPVHDIMSLAEKLYSAMEAVHGRAVDAQDRVNKLHEYGQTIANSLEEKAEWFANP